MQSLTIALKDLGLLLRERGTYVNVLIVPLIFIIIWSGGYGGLTEEEEDSRIPLKVANLDTGTVGDKLVAAIEAAGGVRPEPIEEDDALQQMEDRGLARVLIIEEDFSANLAAGRQATARLVNVPDMNLSETQTVAMVVNGAAQEMQLEQQLVASLEQMGEMQAASGGEAVFSQERIVNQATTQYAASQDRPLIAIDRVEARAGLATEEGEEVPEGLPATNIIVPGMAVLFVFGAAQTTARSIFSEKRIGSFRRLLAAPLSKPSLMAGKLLPNFIIVVVQFLVLFGAAVFILPQMGLDKMTFGDDPLAVGLVIVAVALCTTSLGIFVSAFARSEAQIGGFGTLVLWGFGLIGGSVVPPFLLPDVLRGIGQFTPHRWAVSAFNDLFVFGRGLADVAPDLAVLLAFTALFAILGIWRFDYD